MFRFLSMEPKWRGLLLCAVCLTVALTGCALWFSHATANAASQSSAAANSDGVMILLGLADKAFDDHDLVAPGGSNMYEFYLSVLQLDPNNTVAIERMKQAFEPASRDVEGAASGGDLDEADREIRLLRDYDVNHNSGKNNYKLDLLGSYIDAQRHQLKHKHEVLAPLIQGQQAARNAISN